MDRGRTSYEQHALLIEFMEQHGDLIRLQPGLEGRVRADGLWRELANILNATGTGGQKSVEKWKKVWADWKSKTKKRALLMRQHASGTGGGPHSSHTLSPLEERLLAIMGVAAVEGLAEVEEQGFDMQEQLASSASSAPMDDSPELMEMEDEVLSPSLRLDLPATSTPRALHASTSQSTPDPQHALAPQQPRERNLHERESERLRLEARRLDLDAAHNAVLARLADMAQAWLDRTTAGSQSTLHLSDSP